jgi:serine kinase of HPr protein (carbohydrate metabolism regulator)
VNVDITHEDINFERAKSIRESEVENIPYIEHSDAHLETIALQRKLTEALFEHNTLLFHGSVIAVDGVAYLFTAKSGTGKSTHTRLWREMLGDRAIMVNDDKPFLTITDEGVIAHGSPWNGKHRLGSNISVPLRAICILERGETNKIEPISPSKAVHMLIQQSSRPRNVDLVPKYMELLDALTKRVKFYRLACNMNPEAAEIAFSAMSS